VIAKVKLGCIAVPDELEDDELALDEDDPELVVEVLPDELDEAEAPPSPLLDDADEELDEELDEAEVELEVAPPLPVGDPRVTSGMPSTCWQLAIPSAAPRATSAVLRVRVA
jgi:hypothetical protein